MTNKSSCIFCDIIHGSVDSVSVYEDAHVVAFLDHRPLFPGHCLVVPKQHYTNLYDLPIAETGDFFTTVQTLSQAIQNAMQAEGSFVAINNNVSQSVPHLHVHVVPRKKGDGLKGFFWPRYRYANETEMKIVQANIKKCLQKITKSRS